MVSHRNALTRRPEQQILAPLALSAITPPLVWEWFAAVTTAAHAAAAARPPTPPASPEHRARDTT